MLQEAVHRKWSVMWSSEKKHSVWQRALKELQGILRTDSHQDEHFLVVLHYHSVDQRQAQYTLPYTAKAVMCAGREGSRWLAPSCVPLTSPPWSIPHRLKHSE